MVSCWSPFLPTLHRGDLNIPADDDIRSQAEALLEAAAVTRPPVDLRDVISVLNLSLVHRERDPFTPEATLVALGDGHAIELRGGVGERRRRFTIAHEIGHFMLHPQRAAAQRGGPTTIGTRALERQADAFAAELLMPAHLVRQAALEEGADARRLADRFEVSVAAMSTRLRRLGLAERQSDLLPPSGDLI